MKSMFPSFDDIDYRINKELYYVEELKKLRGIMNPVFAEVMICADEVEKLIEMKIARIKELTEKKQKQDKDCPKCGRKL